VDAFGLPGQQAGEGPIARPEVGNPYPGGEEEEHLADGFPGSSWTVVTAESVRYEVEVLLRFLASFFDYPLKGPLIGGKFGFPGAGSQGRLNDVRHPGRQVTSGGVEGFFAVAAVVG
jgi:hypothetical protein